ncbi:MAG: hypothetical protein A3J48_02450 [Candidatus Doudnabacteria bacterium RIFCSPHIGHO2_02_FULL_46_11]|uniref:Uncharacterized protein n=1 Tax=Candidatus Doudnabacteria bacterium RIFCSPHIGHO2_02_FULL_46_11 TaxID=1817832 RepID=A0A1F5P903_9BACT|nr:MAG: hypothetical protein A3J48_02450 [Candidatus Doudnabacteria bacterium RIFCSPHIGHO2_02_FULL_46_11]
MRRLNEPSHILGHLDSGPVRGPVNPEEPYKKVDAASQEYKESQELSSEILKDQHGLEVFGGRLFERVSRLDSSLAIAEQIQAGNPAYSLIRAEREELDKSIESDKIYLSEDIQEMRDVITDLSKDQTKSVFVKKLFEEIFTNSALLLILKNEKIVSSDDKEQAYGEFIQNFSLISLEALVAIAGNHLDIFNKKSAEFNKVIATFVPQLRAYLSQAIEKGVLPLEPEVLPRLDSLSIKMRDPLLSAFEEINGEFRIWANEIVISEYTVGDLKSNIVHEIFHALSGRTIVGRNLTFEDIRIGEFEMLDANHQRIGLRFVPMEPNSPALAEKYTPRFRWLNEALTDYLMQRVLGANASMSYNSEIRLFRLLAEKAQIPENLFVEAYFENYKTDVPRDERIPKWKELWERLNKAFGSGFMVRLDQLVEESGIEEAIKEVEENFLPS